jgi:hypothetical protein
MSDLRWRRMDLMGKASFAKTTLQFFIELFTPRKNPEGRPSRTLRYLELFSRGMGDWITVKN